MKALLMAPDAKNFLHYAWQFEVMNEFNVA